MRSQSQRHNGNPGPREGLEFAIDPASQSTLLGIAERLPLRFYRLLLDRLSRRVADLGDVDRAINNLARLAERDSDLVCRLLGEEQTFFDLLVLFSNSQSLSDHILRDSASLEQMRGLRGKRLAQAHLKQQVLEDIAGAQNENDAMAVLRTFKARETLRIAIGDLILKQRLEQVTEQISFVAAAVVEAAYQYVFRALVRRFGNPRSAQQQPCRFVVLALGKLGGQELNYSSDIDLMMVYDEPGTTSGGGIANEICISNDEFYSRLCRDFVRLINETTEHGFAYRVDLRLRPNGKSGRICNSLQSLLQYYDLHGRTWERQAWVKALPVAGDRTFGNEIVNSLANWIYQKNLSRADIAGIKALKRKIERRALEAGEDRTNLKTGRGGIRDVEFVIQFMQLLHGAEVPDVRTTNTLTAIHSLERAKCLTNAEATVLGQNYVWLRTLEHRLQMLFDLQTHTLPSDLPSLSRVARQMGFSHNGENSLLDQFQAMLQEVTESNRVILNHLLHDSFGTAFGSLRNTSGIPHRLDVAAVPEEVDLILDEEPAAKWIESVLSGFGFQDPQIAYGHLMELAKEESSFLSSRRCKHFLATVAPALLAELSRTPDPDASIKTLARVSSCLGAKGVLWELFSFNPPTLSLYVRLCASSDYLTSILKSNPGMIDELMDALQMGSLPSYNWLEINLSELTRGATDLGPIIQSFKNTQHMRVGIRDILARDDVRDTHQALSNVAEVCLRTIARQITQRQVRKYALPEKLELIHELTNPFVILALGKLGGREPNYHSDLDVIFLYDSNDSIAQPFEACLQSGTSCQFFFSELAAEITKAVGKISVHGRLYEIDSRLRPTGKSGALAVSMSEFERYFEVSIGKAQLWERQAICKARPVFGSRSVCQEAQELVHRLIVGTCWRPEMVSEIRAMRNAMEKDCSDQNLKRGVGGTVDVEFIVQMLQLRYACESRSVLEPGTLVAIGRLVEFGFLERKAGERLAYGYQTLRSVEARLRLMNTTARHDLPSDRCELEKLAYLLNYATADQMVNRIRGCRAEIRTIFDQQTSKLL